jgi:hypothetical protein
MAKRREKWERRSVVVEPDEAGIDIGAEEIYIAVPPDRDEESTRRFSSFTGDLHALADWLGRCRIRTVAMSKENRGANIALSVHVRAEEIQWFQRERSFWQGHPDGHKRTLTAAAHLVKVKTTG